MKNLVYFAKVLKNVKAVDSGGNEEENDDNKGMNQQPSFAWFVRRMRRIVNLEVARTPATHTLVSKQ